MRPQCVGRSPLSKWVYSCNCQAANAGRPRLCASGFSCRPEPWIDFGSASFGKRLPDESVTLLSPVRATTFFWISRVDCSFRGSSVPQEFYSPALGSRKQLRILERRALHHFTGPFIMAGKRTRSGLVFKGGVSWGDWEASGFRP